MDVRIIGVRKDQPAARPSVPTDFGYNLSDPYAVRLDFNADTDSTRWLIAIGLFVWAFQRPDLPSGIGDVVITYHTTGEWTNWISLKLRSREGTAEVAFPTIDVTRFIDLATMSATDNVRETALDIFFEKVEECANQSW